jgi:gas vesicle protein
MAENGKGEFWAFVAGALAGGIVALLYAPAKGEETREKVRATTGELYDKGEGFYVHFRAEAEKLIAEGKKMIDEVSTSGKEKYEETIHKLEETKEKLEQAREKGLEKAEEIKVKVEKKVKKPAEKSTEK